MYTVSHILQKLSNWPIFTKQFMQAFDINCAADNESNEKSDHGFQRRHLGQI